MKSTIENLCNACSAGNSHTVKDILTSNKMYINDTGHHGITPLIWAMQYNQAQIVTYLLSKSELQLDTRDGDGSTAVHR